MWQITLNELMTASFQPNGNYNRLNGIMDWICPLCGEVVGIESLGVVHEKGFLYKREQCRNGHNIDWKGISK